MNNRIAVIYWSQTGNTEAMAEAVYDGAKSAGADVSLYRVSEISPEEAAAFDALALGCPAMGGEVLEESEFEPFYRELEGSLRDKKIGLFGSYGWGDGQWMRDWCASAEAAGADLYGGEGIMANEAPDEEALLQCKALGRGLATV